MTATIHLKAGKEKSLLRRHPWVYSTAVARVTGTPDAGATVDVRASNGRWLATAAYSPSSMIRARVWSFIEGEPVDSALLASRVRSAIVRRSAIASESTAVRLVFGEADRLPGLIVDRYGDQLVTQFQSAGVDAWRDALVDALVSTTGVGNIFDRSDGATRQREGLPPIHGVVRGAEPPALVPIVENDLHFRVDVRRGHKTGFYIDQRDNRRLARRLAARFTTHHGRPPRCLNCFSYTGGFSIALLAGGARVVHSIDSSADALALAAEHVRLNGFAEGAAVWEEADAFEALRRLNGAGESFEIVILDPPKFASSHHHVDRAARAYKDIMLQALKLLSPGGTLLSFSCSGAIDIDLFQKIAAGAVFDAKVDAWLVERLSAGADHPLMMTVPESEYLKGLRLQRVD